MSMITRSCAGFEKNAQIPARESDRIAPVSAGGIELDRKLTGGVAGRPACKTLERNCGKVRREFQRCNFDSIGSPKLSIKRRGLNQASQKVETFCWL